MSTDIENYIYNLSRELNIENIHGVFGNELELIALVKNCPFIYDRSRMDFKDNHKKEQSWNAIANILHSTTPDCKSRWKSLREQYAKIKKAMADNDTNCSRLVQWEFIDDMTFLDEHIKPRRIKRKFRKEFINLDSHNLQQEDYQNDWLEEDKNLDSKELKLIDLVKSCPLLYNKNSFDHKDPNKKEEAWLSISKVMGIPVLDCKTRWKTMRERYARERKWNTEDPNRRPWTFYHNMSFLDAHVRPRRSGFRPILPKPDFTAFVKSSDSNLVTNSGLPDQPMEFQVQKMEYIDPAYQTCSLTVGNSNITKSDSPNSIITTTNQSTNQNNNLDKSDNSHLLLHDEDDLFGQSIAAELKRITERKKKMKLKANIFKLLCEAECDSS